MYQILALEAVFDQLEALPCIKQQIDGKIHVGRAQPGGVESQYAQLERVEDGIGMRQGAFQDRLAEAGVADDLIGRVGTDLDPVTLRICLLYTSRCV